MRSLIATVAVSGLHRGENPQPGAAVISSLRRCNPGLRIIGLSYDPLESSLYGNGMDHPDTAYLIPYPGSGPDILFARLEEILTIEKIDQIIPCLDSEISNYIEIQARLADLEVRCILPDSDSFDRRHKARLPEFCWQANVPTPATRVAMNPAEVANHAYELGYPVYIKGRLYEAHLVHVPGQLPEAYAGIVRTWGWPVMIQEAVFGEEYDVAGIADEHGNILQSCSIRKLLRTSNGKGYGGIVVENADLDQISQQIIKSLKWRGPFELEFLKSSNKPFVLFEINPRFPAWIDFPSQVGCNIPSLLLGDLTPRSARKTSRCKAGQMFIRHSIDLVGDFSDFVEMASAGARNIKPVLHLHGSAK